MRTLTHQQPAAASAAAAAADFAVPHADADTLKLRLVAIGVILVGGLLGVLPPLLGRWMANPDASGARTVRAFSGGTILALALVHIIPEAFEQLGSLTDYPIGGLPVVLGLLGLLFLDYTATLLLAGQAARRALTCYQQGTHTTAAGASTVADHSSKPPKTDAPAAPSLLPPKQQADSHTASTAWSSGSACCAASSTRGKAVQADSLEQHQKHGISSNISAKPLPDHQSAAGHSAADVESQAVCAAQSTSVAAAGQAAESAGGSSSGRGEAAAAAPIASMPLGHSHHHLPSCAIITIKHYVACFTMELGCLFHSVIIGVGIGVITDSPHLISTLMAAMVFHQGVEGLALGSVLAATKLPLVKKLFMALAFAASLPAGIAIGISVADSYQPDSPLSAAVQGVANGVSGGMLLYVSLYSLLGEEFSKADLLGRPGLAAGLAAAALLGVGGMCVIGIWG